MLRRVSSLQVSGLSAVHMVSLICQCRRRLARSR